MSAPILVRPNWDKEFHIFIDASKVKKMKKGMITPFILLVVSWCKLREIVLSLNMRP